MRQIERAVEADYETERFAKRARLNPAATACSLSVDQQREAGHAHETMRGRQAHGRGEIPPCPPLARDTSRGREPTLAAPDFKTRKNRDAGSKNPPPTDMSCNQALEHFYSARDNDTPSMLALRHGLPVDDILTRNRPWYPTMGRHSALREGTRLIISRPKMEGRGSTGGETGADAVTSARFRVSMHDEIPAWIPSRVMVYWPLDEVWYAGELQGYNREANLYRSM